MPIYVQIEQKHGTSTHACMRIKSIQSLRFFRLSPSPLIANRLLKISFGLILFYFYFFLIVLYFFRMRSESELLLVTRQNDTHSPGSGPGRVPSSHQRSELSNTILGTFSRGDKRVWRCTPIPNCLGKKDTLINISVSNGDLICNRMIIPAAPNQGDNGICWYQCRLYPSVVCITI